MRDSLLRFPAGSRGHELTDPEENGFVLFVNHIEPPDLEGIDLQDAVAMNDVSEPEGWTYSTHIVDDELLLDSKGVVTVLAIRGAVDSFCEKR